MPRPPKARQPIKDAALKLFVEQGVHATGMREVARAAGCTEAAIYRHWQNKDDLVSSLFREHLNTVVEKLEESLAGNEPVDVVIRRATKAVYGIYDADPHVFRFVVVVQHELAPYLPDDQRMPHQVIHDFIIKRIDSGEVQGDPVMLAAALIGIFLECSSRVIYGHLPGPMGRHADAVADLVLRVIKI